MKRISSIFRSAVARMAVLLVLIALFSLSAQAQNDFSDPPTKSSSKFVKSKKADVKVVQNKANAKNKGKETTRKTVKQKEEMPTATFYQVEDEPTELKDMNDYQLEVKAAKGNTDAQYLLGYRWVFSESVTDLFKGMGWLGKAADSNHSYAQSLLGYCYDCLDEDETAVKYYKMSADNNNPIGQYYMGLVYANGAGGYEVNFEKAFHMYVLSGKQGCPDAQYAVGFYLFLGLGVERDVNLAEQWIRAAAQNDCEQAKEFIENIPFTEEASDATRQRIIDEAKVTPTGTTVNRTFTSDSFRLTLVSVEMTANETVLYWKAQSRTNNCSINANSNTYICVDGSTKRYTITDVRGIPMTPRKETLGEAGTIINYAEVFPPINSDAWLLEYHNESGINIDDINVRKK